MSPASIFRLTARAWSIASLAFIAMFLIADPPRSLGGIDSVGLLFFPLGVCVGLVIAWRSEAIGGAISLLSLLCFYLWHLALQRALPLGPWFALVAAPGALFLASWLWRRSHPSPATSGGTT